MDVYEQDAELVFLSEMLTCLGQRTMIDVGAELGAVSAHMLDQGIDTLHAFDPHPDNVNVLRARFADDPRVTVHEYAISDREGTGELHVSSDRNGTTLPFGHTLLQRADTSEIAWEKTLSVKLRSLRSLVNAGDIPTRVGIVKIDTEGHDLAVVQGMGSLEAEIVMVEHWTDLPNGLGVCPWTPEEMTAALRSRGFTHYAFVIHRGEFVTIKWDDATVERGAMGNLVFLHDSVLDRLLPAVLASASRLAERAVGVGQAYMHAASERLALVDELKRAASERLALVDELKRAASERLALVDELKEAAELRLQALEATTAQLKKRDAELAALKLASRDG
ncbi:MAG: FkbM family methyltransferase [Solirubrobacteraceae bacterium]